VLVGHRSALLHRSPVCWFLVVCVECERKEW
jgi:hypothetical protein